jgi:hypothetical protein
MHPLTEHERRRGVARVMGSDDGNAGALWERRRARGADASACTRSAPQGCGRPGGRRRPIEANHRARLTVTPHRIHGQRRELHDATAALRLRLPAQRLRARQSKQTPSVLGHPHRVGGDGEMTGHQVDIAPAQCQELALSKAGHLSGTRVRRHRVLVPRVPSPRTYRMDSCVSTLGRSACCHDARPDYMFGLGRKVVSRRCDGGTGRQARAIRAATSPVFRLSDAGVIFPGTEVGAGVRVGFASGAGEGVGVRRWARRT